MVIVEKALRFITKYAPTILTSVGVAGVLSTAVLSARASMQANDLIRRKELVLDRTLTRAESFKLCWKLYIPTAVVAVSTGAAVIFSHGVHSKRNAALVGLYTLSETTFNQYKGRVKEIIGQHDERKIRDAVTQKALDDNPVAKNTVVFTSRGQTLCYDSMSGRYFNSDLESIFKAQNTINAKIIQFNDMPLNEFYSVIGLKPTTLGDIVGWNTDHMLEINPDAMLSDEGQPCIVLNYNVHPDFDRYH